MERRLIWIRHWYAIDLPYQWIGWPNWPTWRWAQQSPGCIGYRDVEDVQWREAA